MVINDNSSISAPQSILYFTIRVAAYVFSPYIERCASTYPKDCRNPGVDAEFLLRVLQSAGIGINFLIADNEDDCEEMVLNGTADVLGQTEVIRVWEGMAPTTMIHSEKVVFLVRKSKAGTEITSAMLKFMDWWAWMLLCIMLLTAYAIMFSAETVMKIKFMKIGRFVQQEFLFCRWRSVHHIASGSMFDHLAWLILSITVGVFGSSLAILYAAGLNPYKLPFSSLSELANLLAEDKCTVVAFEHVVDDFPEVFDHAHVDERYQEFHTHLRRNMVIIKSSEGEGWMNRMLEETNKCITIADYHSRTSFWNAHTHLMAVVGENDERLDRKSYVYFHRKNLEAEYCNQLAMALAAGSNDQLYDHLVKTDALNRGIKTRDDAMEDRKADDLFLNIHECAEYFFMWMAGMMVGTLFLIIERLHPNVQRRNFIDALGILQSRGNNGVLSAARMIGQLRATSPRTRNKIMVNAIAVTWRQKASVSSIFSSKLSRQECSGKVVHRLDGIDEIPPPGTAVTDSMPRSREQSTGLYAVKYRRRQVAHSPNVQ